MIERIAAIIVSYNMPERADVLAEAVLASRYPVDLVLVDNGSDLIAPARHTTLRLEKNVQTTRGWLEGVEYAKELGPHLAYMFIITSAEPAQGDFVADCAELLAGTPQAVGVHPALTPDSTTMWEHMKARGGTAPRQTWMIDNICSMYRADWFENNSFNPALIYGHGIDLEICYKAREQWRTLWIVESSQVKKVTDIGYTMGRMNMSAEDRRRLSFANMTGVLSACYGAHYWDYLTRMYVTDAML